VRLVARDCAGDAAAEVAVEAAPDATREAVLRETVLWLSRARLRRSRILKLFYESLSDRLLGGTPLFYIALGLR
jgi:hypothetical protein